MAAQSLWLAAGALAIAGAVHMLESLGGSSMCPREHALRSVPAADDEVVDFLVASPSTWRHMDQERQLGLMQHRAERSSR